ncbi:MAG TPA: TIGR03364 family FAD-dependent oxidoreductase [Acidimicrobiales bacterium]|nr:TIGR03364 family FAD-dependent oxidoreductase [Acidimicrobiales bacterium]
MTAGRGRIVVVGAGILGTMHALWALELGYEVVHIERELAARGASVRNFGLLWVSGRAPGPELALALRARSLWQEIAARVEALPLRTAGSLTVANSEAELALIKQACQLGDAGLRQFELLDVPNAIAVNPEVSPEIAGALYCRADAIVEPRLTAGALREHLAAEPGYRWHPGRAVVELGPAKVRDDRGDWHESDHVFLCTGASFAGLIAQYVDRPRTRPVRLQMLETAPYPGHLTTALADGDSMRYYPAFDLPGRAALGPQDPVAASYRAQLLLVQRLDGGLTVGDTHEYDEPFPFDVQEEIYDYLRAKAATCLRRPLPPVVRRWAGVYSEPLRTGPGLYWKEEILPGVEVVSGPGGLGMTCSPAIAETSMGALVERSSRTR